jgi:DNA polymerase-3 subunit delta'
MIYPWQQKQWQQLMRAQKDHRLPHALLFAGQRGTGKTHFAECFMRAQLCQQNNADASCTCHSCRLITGKSHPNILWIAPEKTGGAIKVDQIREVTDFVNQTSLQGEYRFVVINPASNLNINAANALLKTLEEPASGSILILITDQISHLPATILSRCQHIHFPRPDTELALTFLTQKLPAGSQPELILRLANGAPLAALEWVQQDILAPREHLLKMIYALSKNQVDPLKAAAEIQKMETPHIFNFMLSFIMDLLRLHLSVDEMVNQDFKTELADLRARTVMQKIAQFQHYLLDLCDQLQKGINLNKQLMLECMLIRWMECSVDV